MNPVRAWAHCGSWQIAYTRAGSGPTLLVLTTTPLEVLTGAPADPARSFRMIRPELAVADAPLCARCLVDFLDALGTCTAIVVADRAHAAVAHALSRLDPDRIERVIIIGDDPLHWPVVIDAG